MEKINEDIFNAFRKIESPCETIEGLELGFNIETQFILEAIIGEAWEAGQ